MSKTKHKTLNTLNRKLKRCFSGSVTAGTYNGSVVLKGTVSGWNEKIKAGYIAAGRGFRSVINEITAAGISEPEMSLPCTSDMLIDGRDFDVVIIGGGVIGCAVARELSKKSLRIAVFEKESDLAMQTSGRNDGMIHPGFAASPGSKKAEYNVRGNRMYTRLADELDFELKRPGSILLFKNIWMNLLVPVFNQRCRKNGVDGNFRRLSAADVKRIEPNVTVKQKGGFILPSAGIVSPYRVTIAFAENAAENGAEIFLNTAVTEIMKETGSGGIKKITGVRTNRGTVKCRVLVNAAGVWSDKAAEMAGDMFFSVHGRKGTDAILDRSCGPLQNHILGMPSLFSAKNSHSKGGGLVPCVEGNILLGPTAEEVPGREDFSTNREEFGELIKQLDLNEKLGTSKIINYYSGVRAASYDEDFIIERSPVVLNLVHAAAIQSPGLASAPAIAEDVAALAVEALVEGGMTVSPNQGFNPRRRGIPCVKNLPDDERNALIKADPAYGEILCRCEEVSRGEIRDAMQSKVPALTVDGIKRRVRAGAGRCHGGFCLPRVIRMMADELGVNVTDVTKSGGGSEILCCETKEDPLNETV